jgi:hypothetical protein
MKNYYLVLLAKGGNDCEAISEAYEILKKHSQYISVEIRECGTQNKIATVFKDGTVSGRSKK